MPDNHYFGIDTEEHYGILTSINQNNQITVEKVMSEIGDYGRVYDAIYQHIVLGKDRIVKPEETLFVMKVLETGKDACYPK